MPSKLNWREEEAREYANKEGWTVLDKGWPDFLLFKEETGECICLEVKSPTDELSREQKKMHWILRKLKIDVRTVVIGGKKWKRKLQAAVEKRSGNWRKAKPKADNYGGGILTKEEFEKSKKNKRRPFLNKRKH